MKVLHIDTEKSWRGGQNQLLNILKASKNSGIESHVVLQPNNSFSEKIKPYSNIHAVPMRNDLDVFAAIKIASICKENKIDIVDAQTARAHSIGLWLKFFYPKIKLIVHKRVETKNSLGFFDKIKIHAKSVAHYITVSNAIKNGLIDLGIDTNKVTCIYSGIDISQNITPEREFICHISTAAHLSDKKGIDVLITALSHLKSKQSWHCFIAGDGPNRAELEALVKKYNLTPQITFLGFQDSLTSLMAKTDIFVLPTLWEGLGTVLLEAGLTECALIASNVGGVPEIVLDGKTGLLSEPSNPSQLAAQIDRLLSDPSLRKSLATNAREHVMKNFSAEQSAQKHIELYKRLIS